MTIKIKQHQELKSDPELKVLDPSGTYDECDLITCYKADDPTQEPYCKVEARYVAQGDEAYLT